MNSKNFLKNFGNEPMVVEPGYATRSMASNYKIEDCFVEFADNAYDARIPGTTPNFSITIDNETHQFIIEDDGQGIKDPDVLFTLGKTTKTDGNTIGRYGIGVIGAASAIGVNCRYKKDDIVDIVFISAHNGSKFIKHYGIGDREMIGRTEFECCDKSLHFTKIIFNNVELPSSIDISQIIDALNLTFEETINKGFNIKVNGRLLGKTGKPTFIGDETIERFQIFDDVTVGLKYRIIGGAIKDERQMDQSAIRIYDEESGRLLVMDLGLWKSFTNYSIQPSACGVRVGIYIPSNDKAYKCFGIKMEKNGCTKTNFRRMKAFNELCLRLREIYKQTVNKKDLEEKDERKIIGNGITICSTSIKFDGIIQQISPNNYIVKSKITKKDVDTLLLYYAAQNEVMMALKQENTSLKEKNRLLMEKMCAVEFSK